MALLSVHGQQALFWGTRDTEEVALESRCGTEGTGVLDVGSGLLLKADFKQVHSTVIASMYYMSDDKVNI